MKKLSICWVNKWTELRKISRYKLNEVLLEYLTSVVVKARHESFVKLKGQFMRGEQGCRSSESTEFLFVLDPAPRVFLAQQNQHAACPNWL